DAQFMREFQGPDSCLFVDHPSTKGRFLCTLNMDFLVVERMKLRGPKTSAKIVSVSCLSIPGNKRVDLANLYLSGIISGVCIGDLFIC
ncbi:hypothetical protein L208DRAFT_1263542, partial [Tricholoma matsutake]